MNRKLKAALEAITVISVAGVLFCLSREAGIEFRGNTRYGGEVCVPVLTVGGYYFIKGIVRDVRRGLFRE